jgi:hypothetical protein
MKEKLNSLPIIVYYADKSANNGGILRSIWVTKYSGEAWRRLYLSAKLKSLIVISKACHLQLTKYAEEKLPEISEKLSKKEFFEWIHDLLMKQVGRNLPLFGNFVSPNGFHSYDHNINLSNFSDPQISLMHYFATFEYHPIMVHLSLSLIHYFYKSQQNKAFIQLFSDEKNYWEVMIRILKNIFSVNSSFKYKEVLDSLEI